ncbi:MAG: hypothetical protein LBC56_00800 [Oscillospiraceae bacterium]|jgi:hypothetical protein|nr:hypothetical protein [Oscillospiraceae bacterium]
MLAVSVNQQDAFALFSESEPKTRGGHGLADPAFSCADKKDFAHKNLLFSGQNLSLYIPSAFLSSDFYPVIVLE